MKIILKEDVFKLGSEGTVCEVKAGFARNYLLPKNFAVFADEHNIEIFRQKKRTIEKKRDNKTKEAIELKIQLDKIKIDFLMRSNESGKLFHSVNNANIADELKKLGFSIERKRIDVPGDVLKNIGLYEVVIKLYEDINSTIKVEIKEEFKQKKEMPSKKIEDVQQQNGA